MIRLPWIADIVAVMMSKRRAASFTGGLYAIVCGESTLSNWVYVFHQSRAHRLLGQLFKMRLNADVRLPEFWRLYIRRCGGITLDTVFILLRWIPTFSFRLLDWIALNRRRNYVDVCLLESSLDFGYYDGNYRTRKRSNC